MADYIQCADQQLSLLEPQVMGILNVTPDSFSDGGDYFESDQLAVDKALFRAEQMLAEGASIVDVGGESTRPGAAPVTSEQEMARVLPVVEAIAQRLPVVISVDTSNPALICEAAALGAGMVNDVRALQREGAVEAAASTQMAVCLMHMQGNPQTMQDRPQYQDVGQEVIAFLKERLACCRQAGIADERLCIDPGFGFGKTLDDNLQLMAGLSGFDELAIPVLIGVSRKSMIGAVLNNEVDQRLAGSLALATLSVMQGASILRVHDVQATVDAVRMTRAVMNAR